MIDNSKLEQIADNIIDTVLDYVKERHGQEAYEIVASWREKDWLKEEIIDNLSYASRYDDEAFEAMAPFYPAFDNAGLLVRYIDRVDFQTDDKVFMKEAVEKILINSVWSAKKDGCRLLKDGKQMANQLNEENVAEFIGQIADILEDHLTEKGVAPRMLPNEDRDRDYGSSDDDGAIIYGSDYDFIDEAVREELDVLGLVGTGVVYKNLSAVYLSACHIFDNGYCPIIKKIDGLDWTKEDTEDMHDMIVLTFKNWELYGDDEDEPYEVEVQGVNMGD